MPQQLTVSKLLEYWPPSRLASKTQSQSLRSCALWRSPLSKMMILSQCATPQWKCSPHANSSLRKRMLYSEGRSSTCTRREKISMNPFKSYSASPTMVMRTRRRLKTGLIWSPSSSKWRIPQLLRDTWKRSCTSCITRKTTKKYCATRWRMQRFRILTVTLSMPLRTITTWQINQESSLTKLKNL